jgi:hypothetical protein
MQEKTKKKIEEAGINTITQSRLEATLEYRSVDERFTGSSSDLEDIREYSSLSVPFKLEIETHVLRDRN